MRFSSTIFAILAASLLLLLVGSIEVSGDAEDEDGSGDGNGDEDEFGTCWGGGDWNTIWWGLGMIAMMSGGILVFLIVVMYLMKGESLHFPNIFKSDPSRHPENSTLHPDNLKLRPDNSTLHPENSTHHLDHSNSGSFQQPPPTNPTNNAFSQLDIRYARGEISREEYISTTIDDFINRFADEE